MSQLLNICKMLYLVHKCLNKSHYTMSKIRKKAAHHFFPRFPGAFAAATAPFSPDSASSAFAAVFFPPFLAAGSSAPSFDALEDLLALLGLGSGSPSLAAFFTFGFLAGATFEAVASLSGVLGLAS